PTPFTTPPQPSPPPSPFPPYTAAAATSHGLPRCLRLPAPPPQIGAVVSDRRRCLKSPPLPSAVVRRPYRRSQRGAHDASGLVATAPRRPPATTAGRGGATPPPPLMSAERHPAAPDAGRSVAPPSPSSQFKFTSQPLSQISSPPHATSLS
ncbi:hypothetical protein GUJ93_ZPchr0012g20876, partial [Zizania palustris]